MKLKSFLSHVYISLFSLWVLGYMYQITDGWWSSVYAVIHIIILFCIYGLSGYHISKKLTHFNIWNYSTIAIFGSLLWLACLLDSGGDLDWKHGPGGMWLFYHIYIVGFGLPFSSLPKLNNTSTLTLLLLFSILPSVFQLMGGYFRVNRDIRLRDAEIKGPTNDGFVENVNFRE